MSYSVTFKNRPAMDLIIAVTPDTQVTVSTADVISSAVRNQLELRFSADTSIALLTEIFTDDTALSEITITSTDSEAFVHFNYRIGVELKLSEVDGQYAWVMRLAQCNDADLQLRQLVGEITKQKEFLTFNEYLALRIKESNDNLKSFLENNPLYSDCAVSGVFEPYNATESKRNLFVSNYMVHTLMSQLGTQDVMSWNISGQPCTPWTDECCLKFMLAMRAYITPLVQAQQEFELALKACTTKEELDSLTIDYSVVNAPNHIPSDAFLIGMAMASEQAEGATENPEPTVLEEQENEA